MQRKWGERERTLGIHLASILEVGIKIVLKDIYWGIQIKRVTPGIHHNQGIGLGHLQDCTPIYKYTTAHAKHTYRLLGSDKQTHH